MRIASAIGTAFAAAFIGSVAAAGVHFDTSTELVQVTMVSPGLFDFTQSGFSGGATVTGFFTGTDLDNNGQLSSFAGEVSGFGATFSGNAKVAAFTLGLSSLFAVVYDLDGGPLGDGLGGDIEGIGTVKLPEYIAGAGPFGAACDGTSPCGAVVSSVPEPVVWATMMLGLAGVGAAMRSVRANKYKVSVE